MTLQERMDEEDVEGHSFLGIAAQQAEEEILKFWRRSNGNPEKKIVNNRCQ